MITRYAPTPSGFLHLGNAVNFVLTAMMAEQMRGKIALRIDDADTARVRSEYVDDIFEVLAWLDLPWHIGPNDPKDLPAWSQSSRRARYEAARDQLLRAGVAYACECSRRDWFGYEGESCPGQCQERGMRFRPGRTSLRLDQAERRSVVLWRADDTPAYHLASVVDDDAWAVDFVLRGEDLREATLIQQELSRLVPGSTFHQALVLHHPLLLDASGAKLSKSAGAGAAPMPRTEEMRSAVHAQADRISSMLPGHRLRNPES